MMGSVKRAAREVRCVKYALWIVLLCPMALAASCPSGQAKQESVLIQTEQTWARSLEHSDTAALGCILADEFEDAGPDGKLTDRATTSGQGRPASGRSS